MKKNIREYRLRKYRLIAGSGIVALFGVVMLSLFTSSPSVLPAKAIASENHAGTEQVELQIDGMTCRKCVKPMRKAILGLPGVTAAEVSYAKSNAVVEFKKGSLTDEQLVQVIEDKSDFFYTYNAKVISRK